MDHVPAETSVSPSGGTLTAKPCNVHLRHQSAARRTAVAYYPFKCCVICGLQAPGALEVAHLDHQAGNNDRDNLAWLCKTHHWMFDCGLYPIEAVKLIRDRWQVTQGQPSHKARMKQAGAKAAATRKRSATARTAWATRRTANVPIENRASD